jgi:diguanylate cyclase (GGDEF)-like protein
MTRGGGESDRSPAWQVFESREPFITSDFSSLPNIRPETAALGIKAAMFLPILYGESCRGVLGTGRTQPNYPFEQEDINFGALYTKLAAVALDNVQMHQILREESIRDPLTGLFNRRYMQEALTQEIMKAKRNSRPLAVVMLDLDHFKNLNDTFGHDAGDEALRRLGLLLKTTIRSSDVVCRYGGEEFTLILPETSLNDTLQRMEQLRQDIKALTIRHEGKSIDHLSGSIGIAMYPQHGLTAEALLKSADEALYRAKRGGRDQVVAA